MKSCAISGSGRLEDEMVPCIASLCSPVTQHSITGLHNCKAILFKNWIDVDDGDR